MSSTEPLKLKRADGKVVEAVYYGNSDIDEVEILDIKNLKFAGRKTKDITKSDIRNAVFKGEEKLYLQNNKSKMIASLPRKHLTKIISTVFTRDVESRHTYLKKEIISNVDVIFYAAIPILKHAELKSEILYDVQIIHRMALPLKIGGFIFLVMITVKERTDYKEMSIDEFAIYDLYSEVYKNKKSLDGPSTASVEKSSMTFRSQYQAINKPFDSSSTASVGNNPMTTRSQCQMATYSINDLVEFVNTNVKNNYR